MSLLWTEVLQSRLAPGARLVFLGHSNGGKCIEDLMSVAPSCILKQTMAIALTDALWSGKPWAGRPEVINWVASDLPTGTNISSSTQNNCKRSAGHAEHVYTTAAARSDFWPWLGQQVRDAQQQTEKAAAGGEDHGDL